MAQYVSAEEFKAEYGSQKLIRLFAFKAAPGDAEPSESAAKAKFDAVATAVSGRIDGYLRRRYSLPLATVPADLKDLCLRMVHYEALLKSPSGVMTDPVRNDYRDCLRWLEQAAEGKVDLGLQPEPTQNAQREPEFSSDEQVMTRDRLSGVL